ncbi:adhesion G-protein coupled receptor G2-like [Sycon ciliatum]|uniref:adhesion G-protein coupled receptor G2-like n=1 Tax=Sycon ciliatum TaxID=27933 RepID=UPI0020AD621D
MALAKARAQLLAVLSACSLSLLSCAVDVVSANSAGDGQQVSPKANPCACLNNGVCDPRSGYCSCLNNFAGAKCEACAFGYSGPGCFVHCSCKNGAECTPGTSVCQCRPGTFGAACEKKCSPGAWGAGCTNKCRCQNGAQCDGGTGCQCVLGYTGRYCNTRPICPLLTLPSNLLLEQSGGNGYLNVTTTRCPDNWLWVSGSHQRVCQDDGTWSGPAASCQPPSTNSPGTTTAPQVQMCSEATIDGLQGKFVWPVTVAGVKRTIVCPVLVAGEPVVLAERKCSRVGNTARWESPQVDNCAYASARTRQIQRHFRGLAGKHTLIAVCVQIVVAKSIFNGENGTTVTSVEADLLLDTVSMLSNSMVSLLAGSAASEKFLLDSFSSFLNVFDILQASPILAPSAADSPPAKLEKLNKKQGLRTSIDNIAKALQLSREDQTFMLQSKSVVMTAVCPKVGESYAFTVEDLPRNATESAKRSLDITAVRAANATNGNTAATANTPGNSLRFTFPSAAVQQAKDAETSPPTTFKCRVPQISLLSFPADEHLNSSNAVGSNDQVATSIVAASVGSRDDSLQLGLSQVQMTMPVHLPSDDLEDRNLTCSYWNKTSSSWRQDGCRLVNITQGDGGETLAHCECNHLTHFAVLVTPPGSRSIDLSAGNEQALFLISLIGCSLSIGCLVLTIVLILSIKRQRGTVQHQLTLCLSVSLSAVLILYMVNATGSGERSRASCLSIALCLHFWLLMSFGFMLVLAYHLYRRLVTVLVQVGEQFLARAIVTVSLACAALVGLNLAIFGTQSYGSDDGQLCFLVDRTSFYATFIAPLVVMFAVNGFIVSVAAEKVRKHYKCTGGERRRVWILTKLVCSMTFLLGLTWLFGALVMIAPSTVALQYMFALLNTMQGVGIFAFHVLLATSQAARDSKSKRTTNYSSGTGTLRQPSGEHRKQLVNADARSDDTSYAMRCKTPSVSSDISTVSIDDTLLHPSLRSIIDRRCPLERVQSNDCADSPQSQHAPPAPPCSTDGDCRTTPRGTLPGEPPCDGSAAVDTTPAYSEPSPDDDNAYMAADSDEKGDKITDAVIVVGASRDSTDQQVQQI